MIEKRSPAGGKILVTFSMPATEGIESLFLVGDFNAWSDTATPMSRRQDGKWSVVLELEAGREYQFRYRDQLSRWHNDEAADFYLPNSFGSENSVISLVVRPQVVTRAGARGETASSATSRQGDRNVRRTSGGIAGRQRRNGGQGKTPKGGPSRPGHQAGPSKKPRTGGKGRRPPMGRRPKA